MNCGSLMVTFLMPIAGLVALHVDDAVDHQERIAVRQRLQEIGDVGRLKRRDASFIVCVRRVASDDLPPRFEERQFTKPLRGRLGRCPAPTLARGHVARDAGGGGDLRAFADRHVVRDAALAPSTT